MAGEVGKERRTLLKLKYDKRRLHSYATIFLEKQVFNQIKELLVHGKELYLKRWNF